MTTQQPARPVVVVLGMHRSGTSWLAGELQQHDIEFGSVNMWAQFNQKGNRENERVVALHDRVLDSAGGRWNRPPREVAWTPEDQAELARFIADMDRDADGVWGFKDPRTLLVFDEWQRQLDGRLVKVGIFRHPAAVCESLLARTLARSDRIRGRRHAYRLWTAYNERLVALHRVEPFPLLRFDVSPSDLEVQLAKALVALELPADADNQHFSADLVHAESATTVPRACRASWEYLIANALV